MTLVCAILHVEKLPVPANSFASSFEQGCFKLETVKLTFNLRNSEILEFKDNIRFVLD